MADLKKKLKHVYNSQTLGQNIWIPKTQEFSKYAADIFPKGTYFK